MCASKSALRRTRAGARREAGAGGAARAVPPAPVTVPPDEGCASNSESEADTDARVGSRSSSPKHDSKQATGILKVIVAPHARSHGQKLAKQVIAAAVELASAASMVAAGRAAAACVSLASLHAGLSESTTGVAFACAWAAAYARMLAGAAYMSVQASRGRMLPRREQLSWWECAALLVRGAVVMAPADATVALLASRGARAAGISPLALPDVGFGVLDAALALLAYCLWFVVTNFVLEAAFDFAHYWLHRTMHMSPVLYRHLHARHHLHTRPVALCLLEQSMGEYWLASTVLPCAFAQVVARRVFRLPAFSVLESELMLSQKLIIEFAGHCGSDTTWSSFPTFMWLPRMLGCELYVCDHDLHHSAVRCNYGKRLSVWDKAFGTYRRSWGTAAHGEAPANATPAR